MTKRSTIGQAIIEQANWIVDHGGSEAAYVARYGSRNDPNHYGDGGEAIYAADVAYFNKLVRQSGGRR
jgi:hypothetical protein